MAGGKDNLGRKRLVALGWEEKVEQEALEMFGSKVCLAISEGEIWFYLQACVCHP